jgi:membrane fusion protein (multidrug efflux system)
LPLDVIIGAIVIPTQAVIPVQNGKKVFFLILEKEGSWSKLQQEQMLPINFIWLKAGDTVITKWCNGFEK